MVLTKTVFSVVAGLVALTTNAAPLNKRIAQVISDSTTQWVKACTAAGGADKCGTTSQTAFMTLLAGAGDCDQQNAADDMIDLAKSLKNNAQMISLAQVFAQQPRNSPDKLSVNYCQQQPKNAELKGLFQCQFQGVDPQTFTKNVKVGGPGTVPLGLNAPLDPPGSCKANPKGGIADGSQLVTLTQNPGVDNNAGAGSGNSTSGAANAGGAPSNATGSSNGTDGSGSSDTGSSDNGNDAGATSDSGNSTDAGSTDASGANAGSGGATVTVTVTAGAEATGATGADATGAAAADATGAAATATPTESATGGASGGSDGSAQSGSGSASADGAAATDSGASATASAGGAAATGSFQLQNGQDAQALNAKFASLTDSSSCEEGDQACVSNGFAQCVGGKFQTTQCASGTQCFALPLVNKAGTSIACTTQSDATSRIQATGATGGLTGA